MRSSVKFAFTLPFFLAALPAPAQDLALNPTRPTVSNSAGLQNPGVLQIETGYDAYPQRVPGNQQTVDTLATYTVLPRLRLDFYWSTFNHFSDDTTSTNATGDIQLGGKVEFKKEDYHRLPPGIALQYEAELPTSPDASLKNLGQQAILLVNHHYGPHGDLDILLNASIVQSGCQAGSRCSYGGQQSLAVSYHVTQKTRLYAEAFAQNVTQSNTPPGTYVFGGFYHPLSDSFGIDGGMRFGVSDHSASVGTTVGLVFSRRLHGSGPAEPPTR